MSRTGRFFLGFFDLQPNEWVSKAIWFSKQMCDGSSDLGKKRKK
jgi:hypothetical protein